HLAREQLGVTHREPPADGLHERTDRRGDEERLLGQRPRRHGALERAAHLDRVARAPVRDHADRLGVVRRELAERDVDRVLDLVRGALVARDDEQHGRAEVRRDARVERQLGRARDVGVVRTDHDDGVALARHRVEARDDRRERGLLVGVHVLVGHPDAVLVGQVHAVVPEQQLEHVVTLVGAARDRPEHPDALHAAGEQVEQPERDRGLARLALRGRDVDGPGAHSLSPPVLSVVVWGPPTSVAVSPASGHTHCATSGMSSPWSRVYWRARSRASIISWRSSAARAPSEGTRSITSITRWYRSRSLSMTMSNGVVVVPSSLYPRTCRFACPLRRYVGRWMRHG